MISLDELDVEEEWRRFHEWAFLLNQRRLHNEELSIDLTPETETIGIALGYTAIPGRWRIYIPHWSEEEAKDWIKFKLCDEYTIKEYMEKYDLDYVDQFPWPYELVDAFAALGLVYRCKHQDGIQPISQIFLSVDGMDLAKNIL